MLNDKKEEMPMTWETAITIHLSCIMRGSDEDAKRGAMFEIMNCAKGLDKANDQIRSMQVEIDRLRVLLNYDGLEDDC